MTDGSSKRGAIEGARSAHDEPVDDGGDVRPGVRVWAPFGSEESERSRYDLYADVLEELWFSAQYRDEPSFALLHGGESSDAAAGVVELTGFSDFQYTGSLDGLHHPVRVTLERRIDADVGERREAAAPVAGLFVAAPGGEAELRPELARLHLSLFNAPGQVLVVADPDAWSVAMYRRRAEGHFSDVAFRIVYRPNEKGDS